MRGLTICIALIGVILLGGCSSKGTEYDARSYNRIKKVDYGTIVAHRYVRIQDDGSGRSLGALIGAVLGSVTGRAEGRRLATLGGGILGGVIGTDAGKADAEELTLELDNGETVVVVVKGDSGYEPGERVRIVRDGNVVATVDRTVP